MQNHITDPDAATNNPWLVADLAAIADKTRGDPACATERAHALGDWYTVIADVYNGDTLTALGGGSGKPPLTAYDLDRPARTGDVAAALAATAFHENVRLTDTGVASTALLGRLSTTQLRVPGRPATAKLDTNGDLGAGAAAVNIAVGFYGGLFVGDDSGATGLGLVGPVIPYADIFNAVGQSAGVDPRLLAAVARQESNFNPDAGCPDNGPAYGMMQKEPDMEPTVCGDPQRQVEIAAQMLKDRHQEAGDWVGALWGYNNGGTFSRKWREISGDRDKAREFAVDFYCDDGDDSCTRANIAMSYVSDDPGVRSAYGTWLEYQTLFPTQVVSTTQLIVDATGCPRAARSGIPGRSVLRDGSADIGLYQLCADSVAAAASPEAARAIIWAFNNLGVPYSQTLRDTIAFDCSSYLSRAYESAGVPMSLDANGRRVSYSTHYLLPQTGWERPAWIVEIPAFDLKPGDLVFPSEGHVAMVLANGFMIHTNATGDVSKVERLYGSFLQANRVLANLAAVN